VHNKTTKPYSHNPKRRLRKRQKDKIFTARPQRSNYKAPLYGLRGLAVKFIRSVFLSVFETSL
jgi:hypothetical protein